MPISLIDIGGKLERTAKHNLRIVVGLLDGKRPDGSQPATCRAARAIQVRQMLWNMGWAFWTNDASAEIKKAMAGAAATATPENFAVERGVCELHDRRITNILHEHGLKMFDDVLACTACQLLEYPGIGEESLRAIRHTLRKSGQWLKGDEELEQSLQLFGASLFTSRKTITGRWDIVFPECFPKKEKDHGRNV